MIQQKTLADIIQQKVALGMPNPRGFYDVRCAVCNDHLDRGGFKFDSDFTGYSCYNCGSKFKYEEGSGKLSRNAKQILADFGITAEDLTSIRSAMFVAPKEESEISLDDLKRVKLDTPEVALPDRSYPLGHDGHDELQAPLIEYLISRKIDPLGVNAFFSLDPKYLRRVIIPYYRDGKIIYWQARSVDDGVKPRYLNSSAARDAVMYGYDRLFTYDPSPLFVTEGVFDAIVLSGICILGSSLNAAKIEVLKKCRRRVIFVIDRDKTGGELGKQVLSNGWELSFVDKRAADANRSVQLFGLPFTIHTLLQNATTKTDKDGSNIMLALGVTLGKLGAYR
jgi:hypothetical protein